MSETVIERAPGLALGALTGARGRLGQVGVFCGAIGFALIVGAIVMTVTGGDPALAYRSLFVGAFGSLYGFSEVLLSTTPLLFSGLAVAFAFHAGLFNVGVEGQLILGGFAAALAGFLIPPLPAFIHLPLALLAGTLTGALWGAIPGYLKARLGVHEVINTIMLNFIAFRITHYMVGPSGPFKVSGALPASPFIAETARLGRFLEGTRLSGGIFIAFGAAALVWVVLKHTRLGYRIQAVGKNPRAAEYAGIGVPRHIVIAMTISGALSGLAGAVEVVGLHYRFYDAFSPGYGFDAIAIALLGQLHPFGIAVASFLFGALRAGSVKMAQDADISRDLIFIISGIIIFFVAANYLVTRLWRRAFSRERV